MRRVLPAVLLGAGAVMLVAGVVVLLVADRVGEFGWFAYAPLAGEGSGSDAGGLFVLTSGQVLGLSAVGVGVVVLVGAAAYRLGRAGSGR